MDYVQVPAEEEKPEEIVTAKEKNEGQNSEENQTETTKKRVHELVKQMSISAEGSGESNITVYLILFYYQRMYINRCNYNTILSFHFKVYS